MAIYTAFLASWHAIHIRSIKADTVKGYIATTTKFLSKFDMIDGQNVYKINGLLSTPNYILNQKN